MTPEGTLGVVFRQSGRQRSDKYSLSLLASLPGDLSTRGYLHVRLQLLSYLRQAQQSSLLQVLAVAYVRNLISSSSRTLNGTGEIEPAFATIPISLPPAMATGDPVIDNAVATLTTFSLPSTSSAGTYNPISFPRDSRSLLERFPSAVAAYQHEVITNKHKMVMTAMMARRQQQTDDQVARIMREDPVLLSASHGLMARACGLDFQITQSAARSLSGTLLGYPGGRQPGQGVVLGPSSFTGGKSFTFW